MLVKSGSKTSSRAWLRRAGFALVSGAILAGCLCPHVFAATNSEKIDFNFQVRPILADRCFKCHGPDEKARKAKLRLDVSDNAYAVHGKSGTRPIVPRHPEQSELVRRITTSDDDDRMPPV